MALDVNVFNNHLETIVNERLSILTDSSLDDGDKSTKLALFDKENDELNQSLDMYFRTVDFQGLELYRDNLDKKLDIDDLPSLSLYALKTDLHSIPDLTPYAKKEDIPSAVSLDLYALKSELPIIPPVVDLKDYAKKSDIPSPPDLTNYLQSSDIDGFMNSNIFPYVPTLLSSYVHFNSSLGLRVRDLVGYVHIYGIVKSGSAAKVCRVPSSYRPPSDKYSLGYRSDGVAFMVHSYVNGDLTISAPKSGFSGFYVINHFYAKKY